MNPKGRVVQWSLSLISRPSLDSSSLWKVSEWFPVKNPLFFHTPMIIIPPNGHILLFCLAYTFLRIRSPSTFLLSPLLTVPHPHDASPSFLKVWGPYRWWLCCSLFSKAQRIQLLPSLLECPRSLKSKRSLSILPPIDRAFENTPLSTLDCSYYSVFWSSMWFSFYPPFFCWESGWSWIYPLEGPCPLGSPSLTMLSSFAVSLFYPPFFSSKDPREFSNYSSCDYSWNSCCWS